MKRFTSYINEKLKIRPNYLDDIEKIECKTNKDALLFIHKKYEKMLENNSKILSVVELDVSKLDDFSGLFRECDKAEIIIIDGWDTSQGTNFSYMFSFCTNLKSIKGIKNLNVENARTLNGMFKKCENLESIDLSNFHTYNCILFEEIFEGCKKLNEIIGIKDLFVKKARSFAKMFYSCSSLTSLDILKWEAVTAYNIDEMFKNCTELNNVYMNFSGMNSLSTMCETFYDCKNLKYIYGLENTPQDVLNRINIRFAFRNVNLENWPSWINPISKRINRNF